MNVMYLWRAEWKKGRKEGSFWRGNPDIQTVFSNEYNTEIKEIHGWFAAAWEDANTVNLIVDVIGSSPLFYGIQHDLNSIYVSDDAQLIADKIQSKLKHDNVAEFLKTGYVTENETLFNDIYTLNPGTHVRIDKNSGAITEEEWFLLQYNLKGLKDRQKQIYNFNKCLHEVFSDLIRRLSGRTALVPLSGGWDSRLVVSYLKKLGYNSVVCFSYGRPGNWESEKSRKIASHLGYQWLFEEYNADVWEKLMRSDEYYQFLDWSCRGSRIGCLQALPAIIDIKNRKLIPDDAVVIPGHTLDVSLGSHIGRELIETGTKTIEYILEEHYCLADNNLDYGGIDKWQRKIDDTDPVNAYMQWEYRNRQSKFIANDVRTYEFVGYDYELPLWDVRIQEFAMELKLDDLLNRDFQHEFTKAMIDPYVGIVERKVGVNVRCSRFFPLMKRIKNILKKNTLVKKWLEYNNIKRRRFNDTNAFLSWLSDDEYQKYSKELGKWFNLNSIVADDYIRYCMTRK